jgi:hypothetical protein
VKEEKIKGKKTKEKLHSERELNENYRKEN